MEGTARREGEEGRFFLSVSSLSSVMACRSELSGSTSHGAGR